MNSYLSGRSSKWGRPAQWGRSVKLITCMAGAAAIFLCAAPAQAQFVAGSDVESFTWPPISVSLQVRNGWIVAEGRALDQTQGVVWRTPLARAGGGAVLRNGWGSAFASVGGRRFIIDYASGETRELKAGEVYRQQWPPFTPPTAEQPTSPYSSARGNGARGNDRSALIGDLGRANKTLVEALSSLDSIATMQEKGRATEEDVKNARQNVDLARAAVKQAQADALRVLGPELLPRTTMPAVATRPAVTGATPRPLVVRPVAPVPESVRKAEGNLMDISAKVIQARRKVEELSSPAGGGGDPAALATAQEGLRAAEDQLQGADKELQRLRMAESLPPLERLSKGLQTRISTVSRRLLDLTEEQQSIERQLQRAIQAQRAGDATEGEVNQLKTRATAVLSNLFDARKELDELRQAAEAEIKKSEPATQPEVAQSR